MKNTISVLLSLKEKLFLLAVLALPIHKTLNHWFFGGFLLVSFSLLFIEKRIYKLVKSYGLLFALIASFFFIKVFGVFTALNQDYWLKEVVRSLPFLLYPIAIVSFKHDNFVFKHFEKRVFYALVIGCLITAMICWGNVFLVLELNDKPANTFFGWKRSGIFLTRILDIHPPYLGLMIVASILFLLKELFYDNLTKQKTWLNVTITIILFVFLLNLTARNAIIFLVSFCILFLAYKKYWKLLLIPLVSIFLFNILILNHPSEFYRIKMHEMLGLTDSKKVDGRFERLTYSYNVFKSNKVFGVGLGNDNELRIKEYTRNNDIIAATKRLNSHNQFFEYLVAFGVVGGLLFLFFILFFARFFYINNLYIYLILFCNIIIATLTESIFERVLGIQYVTLICSLGILAKISFEKK